MKHNNKKWYESGEHEARVACSTKNMTCLWNENAISAKQSNAYFSHESVSNCKFREKANELHSKSNAAVRDKQVPLMQDHECNCSLVWHDTSSWNETKHTYCTRQKEMESGSINKAVSDKNDWLLAVLCWALFNHFIPFSPFVLG